VDFTTVVVVFLVTGFFFPAVAAVAAIAALAFLGLTPAALFAVERSEAFRLRAPLTMSAGFSPGRVAGALGGMVWLILRAPFFFTVFHPLISI
jgi:hypothetical protein